MRFIALLAALTINLVAQPASAQSVGDILRTVDTARYNNCSYTSGAYEVLCQANRASRVLDTFRSSSRQNRNDASQRLEQRISLINALTRACEAGDQHSCQRVGQGVPQDRVTAARALMEACRLGDTFSCDRANAVLVGSDRNYSGQATRRVSATPSQAAAPARSNGRTIKMGNCLVDVDPATGMRTSGPYNCSQ